MPLGVWRMLPAPTKLLRGMIVISCIGNAATALTALHRGYIGHGDCPDGTEPLLKKIAAVEGDTVEVTGDGIAVNGRPVPNTARLSRDFAGRELPAFPDGVYRVPAERVWLLATSNPLSFDGRYYGSVRVVDIRGIAVPILVW